MKRLLAVALLVGFFAGSAGLVASEPQDLTTLLSKFLTNLWAGNVTFFGSTGTIRTLNSNGATLSLQAYDVDGAAYTSLLTLTAGNTPDIRIYSNITVDGGVSPYWVTGNYLGDLIAFGGGGARSRISSTTDGTLNIRNNAETGFTTLELGPLTGNTANGTWSLSKVHTTIDMATATGTGTGTVTSATTALPANSYIVGVSCRVTTVLAGASLSTWSVGIAGTTDKWGAALAKTVNTEANIATYKAGTAPYFNTSAAGIVFTAAAGVFSTGVVQCTTYFNTFTNIPAV